VLRAALAQDPAIAPHPPSARTPIHPPARPHAGATKQACSVSVDVSPTEAAVGERLCALVADAARSSIGEKGSFMLAVPGGSVLKMLGGLKGASGIDWTKGERAGGPWGVATCEYGS